MQGSPEIIDLLNEGLTAELTALGTVTRALHDALARLVQQGKLTAHPLHSYCAAISVGIVGGTPVLDLPYVEDSRAEVDMNVVMLRHVAGGEARFVEVQGTAEGMAFSRGELDQLLALAELGVVFLLFMIGLGLSIGRLWAMRGSVFGLGGAQIVLTGVAIAAMLALVDDPELPHGPLELLLTVREEVGLEGVPDPSGLFLADRLPGVAGSTVVPTIEGHRPLLGEVQALVAGSTLAEPRPSSHRLARGRAAVPRTFFRTRRWRRLLASDLVNPMVPSLLLRRLAGLAQNARVDIANPLALVGLNGSESANAGSC